MNRATAARAGDAFYSVLVEVMESRQMLNTKGELKRYDTALKAKEAAIRSGKPIGEIHKLLMTGLLAECRQQGVSFTECFPPVGSLHPELKVFGQIKAKKQDVSLLSTPRSREQVGEGPLAGKVDHVGAAATNSGLFFGVRSQLSSINKNFDTLMERAYAEVLNIRLRAPFATLGELYVLPARELNVDALSQNQVGFTDVIYPVEKFIRLMSWITGRTQVQPGDVEFLFRYDISCLLVADFSSYPGCTVAMNSDDLRAMGFDLQDREADMFDAQLSPEGLETRAVNAWLHNRALFDGAEATGV